MAEMNVNKTARQVSVTHRGRGAQVWIYLGKLLRMFIYENDWKVLPMAALIAGLVGMVIRNRLFLNMEGTLMGGFAMVMVCIWNGCFNSIQVICRERDVIKREHRSGMHISSYICAHMIYQALLCVLQTGVTLYVTKMVGVKYPEQGLFTPWLIVDYGISMFLITYASDMMSLWISCIARTTTTAMTIMPFVLIFQLVFSGGMLTLPAWTHYITPFTISNPALKVLAAQGDYNHHPVLTIWNQVNGMRDKEVSATVTVRQVVDLLQSEDNPVIAKLRETKLSRVLTLGEVRDMLESSETFQKLKAENVLRDLTVGEVLTSLRDDDEFKDLRAIELPVPGLSLNLGQVIDLLMSADPVKPLFGQNISQTTTVGDILNALDAEGLLEQYKDMEIGMDVTLGQAVDALAANPDAQKFMDQSYTFESTVGGVIDMIGEDKVKDVLQNKIAEASYKAEYENTVDNISDYWFSLALFVLAFAALSTITLEFIDKDKR